MKRLDVMTVNYGRVLGGIPEGPPADHECGIDYGLPLDRRVWNKPGSY
jgi:hypothetical protein